MSPAPPPANGPTAVQLLLTAERLFAERGLAGVSLRQIAGDAGSNNNSAVHYHYGSKPGLVAAIFAYRLPDLIQRRTLLTARAEPDNLRARLEAHMLPLFELAETGNSAYLSFVEQLQRSGEAHDLLVTSPDILQAQQSFLTDMRHLLPHLAEPLRSIRLNHVLVLGLHTAAERERTAARNHRVLPFGLFVSTTIDAFTGLLNAPISDETHRWLNHSNPGTHPASEVRLL